MGGVLGRQGESQAGFRSLSFTLRASPVRSLGFTAHRSLPHRTQHRDHFWSLWPHPEKDAQKNFIREDCCVEVLESLFGIRKALLSQLLREGLEGLQAQSSEAHSHHSDDDPPATCFGIRPGL